MAKVTKVVYTILFEKGPRNTVRVTVPSLTGFEFRARNRKAAYAGSAGRIERFLAGLVKHGKGIPKEPDGFWVRPDLIHVSLPKARNLSLPEI
jgi:hypothetical protein